MVIKKTYLISLAAVIGFCLTARATTIYESLTFAPQQFAIENFQEQDGNIYSLIKTLTPGHFGMTESQGDPELPSAFFCFIIPYGTRVQNVTAQSIIEQPMTQLTNQLHPVQQPWMTDASAPRPPFCPAGDIYRQNQFYPPMEQIVSYVLAAGCFRGASLAVIEVKPLRYNPVTNSINLISSLTLAIELAFDEYPIIPQRVSSYSHMNTINLLLSFVENPEDVQVYYPPLPAIYENYENLGFPLPNGVPAECVIITGPELANAFTGYAKWLTRRGIPTEITKTTQIYAQYSGRDNAEKIRNFIIDRYNRDGLSYVLLGGNHRVVPKRLCFHGNTSVMPREIDQQICDLYYADVHGNWDRDGDGVFGEPNDDSPDIVYDVAVGRVPVTSIADVGAWVAKRLRFELDPGGGNHGYLNRVAVQSADEMRDRHEYRAIYHAFDPFFDVDTVSLLEQPSGYDPNPTGPTLDTFICKINAGLQFLISQAHGSPDFYNIRTSGYNNLPAECYSVRDIDNVSASGQEYITFCLACWVGAMDAPEIGAGRYPCLAQADLVNPNGATAARYNSRYGWVATSYRLDESTISNLIADECHNIAGAHYTAKIPQTVQRDIIYGNTYFGCPVMCAWASYPQTMQIVYPETLRAYNGGQNVTITALYQNMPVANVLVTIWKGKEVYARGITNTMGRVNLRIGQMSPGIMLMTANKTDFLPVLKNIIVAPSISPLGDNLNPIGKAAEVKQPLIWNPLRHPSGDSLRAALTQAGYFPLITDSLGEFSDSLERFTLFIVGGMYEYFEPWIQAAFFNQYLGRLLAFLDSGGSVYWEGAVALFLQDSVWFNRFQYDISVCYQYPASYLRGDDTLFLSEIDSLGYDESDMAEGSRAIGSTFPMSGMEVATAPEAFITCNTKAVAYYSGIYRTFVANYSFARLHDRYVDTRVELIAQIMAWLNGASDIEQTPTPARFYLAPNYPNPFNRSTNIEYSIAEEGEVRLEVFNVLGQRIETLVERAMKPGVYRTSWEAGDIPSGMYFYCLTAGKRTQARKMLLLK